MKVRHTVDATLVKPRVKKAVIATTLSLATLAAFQTPTVTSGIKMLHDGAHASLGTR